MFKCGSYALLFALSLIGFSIGFSDSASAASHFDDLYRVSPDLYLSDTRFGDCDPQDVSDSWYTTALNATTSDGSGDGWKASLQSAVNGDGRWIVSQYVDMSRPSDSLPPETPEDVDLHEYTIYWTEDDSLSLQWFNPYAPNAPPNPNSTSIFAVNEQGTDDGVHFINIRLQTYYGRCDDIVARGSNTWYNGVYDVPVVGHWGGGAQRHFYNYVHYMWVDEDNLNIPVGYEGIPVENTPVSDSRQTVRPDFKYTIVDKQMSLSDHNQALPEFVPEEGYNMVEYLVEWTVIRCEGHDPDEDFEQQGLCAGSEYVTSERLPQSDTFEYEVAEYGNYQLRAQYLIHQCHRYPSYPTTPDYCFYVEVGTQYEAYDWGETTKNVTIDGRTIIGDTDLESCDEFNICTRPSQDSVISDYFQDKNASGLMMFLQAPIVFYQSLPAMTQNCTPITVPFLGGRTFELECLRPRYQQLSPFLYTMFQTVINGVVAYAVATKIFARIKNVNDPENDRIEVARL